ncbi:DUF418 domain-containing protein [Deinococcus deserti]|uniref:DUF418 domain-containing protein n=1 Tax=Deinococcus deserti (strain DSM 17065 / CIP 109153 / LMG 22923 / VCD115) TaxID=546414 RepID=C1CYH9_DEIDV|nr:DUF418 domain-containing protein [Deinococcus deserti]ACO45000.1 Conserved hypothetical protein; putative membrane protein [Deinococcus deserti VCD115]
MTAPDPAASLPADVAPEPAEHGPVRERSVLPDVLRGVALVGILVVNMQDFAGFLEWQQRGLDRVAQALTDVLANGRFISIFAMLFGWGAAGLLARQGAGVFVRRHLLLLLIGALHFVLVWHGDIISNYALMAGFLLFTARLNARALLTLGIAVGAWGQWVWLMDALVAFSRPERPRFTGLPDLSAGSSYAALVAERATEFWPNVIGGNLYNGPWLLCLFFLGAAAQRTGLLLRPQDHLPLLHRLAVVGVPLGLLLGVALAYLNTQGDRASGLLAIPVRMTGGLAGGLGYVGLIGLLTVTGRLGVLRAFAASGRVAMSNYLAQSLVMTTLFYPYAGGLTGQFGAASAVVLALALGLLQIPVSMWWLRHFGTGPMEWLVRTLVYGPALKNSDVSGPVKDPRS